jgi:hypothetical protein
MSQRSRRIRANRKRKALIAKVKPKARRQRAFNINAQGKIAKLPGDRVFQGAESPRPVITIGTKPRARIHKGTLLVPRSAL